MGNHSCGSLFQFGNHTSRTRAFFRNSIKLRLVLRDHLGHGGDVCISDKVQCLVVVGGPPISFPRLLSRRSPIMSPYPPSILKLVLPASKKILFHFVPCRTIRVDRRTDKQLSLPTQEEKFGMLSRVAVSSPD